MKLMRLSKSVFFEMKRKITGALDEIDFKNKDKIRLLFNYLTCYEIEKGLVEGFCYINPPAASKGYLFVKAKKDEKFNVYDMFERRFFASKKLEIKLSKRAFLEFETKSKKAYKHETSSRLRYLKETLDDVEFYSNLDGKRRGIRLFSCIQGGVFSNGVDEKIRCAWGVNLKWLS